LAQNHPRPARHRGTNIACATSKLRPDMLDNIFAGCIPQIEAELEMGFSYRHFCLPQASSISRVAAGAAGFCISWRLKQHSLSCRTQTGVYRPGEPKELGGDSMILSKGHGCLALWQ